MYIHVYIYIYIYTHIYRTRWEHAAQMERSAPRGNESVAGLKADGFQVTEALLVKCPSVQWQLMDLTIHTKKWFLGAGFLGACPTSLKSARVGLQM